MSISLKNFSKKDLLKLIELVWKDVGQIWLENFFLILKSVKLLLDKNKEWSYPKYQINTMEIPEPIKYLDLVITALHEEQNKAYKRNNIF